jgi:hypothetical protein
MDSSRQAHNAEPQGLLPACVVGISSDDIRLKVIGIGSGSTVPYVVERILAQGSEVNKDRVFIPTGFQSKELIVEAQLRLGDVDQYPYIDVTIDGADEVDKGLSCIKGGGACQLREKVLAEAADTCVRFYFITLLTLILFAIDGSSSLTTAKTRKFSVQTFVFASLQSNHVVTHQL